MNFNTLFNISKEDRQKVVERLIGTSYPGQVFFIMIGLAVVIAAIGLAIDSTSVIIGSMLVAPFLSPILSLAMGIVTADQNLIQRSIRILLKVLFLSIIISLIISIFVRPPVDLNEEILSRGRVNLALLYVAIASGLAASIAIIHPKFMEFLVGVAVSVSLLPPLANIGLAIGILRFDIAAGSLQLFLLNLIGIIAASVIIFSLVGFYRERRVVEEEIKEEKKKLEKEKEVTQKPYSS